MQLMKHVLPMLLRPVSGMLVPPWDWIIFSASLRYVGAEACGAEEEALGACQPGV